MLDVSSGSIQNKTAVLDLREEDFDVVVEVVKSFLELHEGRQVKITTVNCSHVDDTPESEGPLMRAAVEDYLKSQQIEYEIVSTWTYQVRAGSGMSAHSEFQVRPQSPLTPESPKEGLLEFPVKSDAMNDTKGFGILCEGFCEKEDPVLKMALELSLADQQKEEADFSVWMEEAIRISELEARRENQEEDEYARLSEAVSMEEAIRISELEERQKKEEQEEIERLAMEQSLASFRRSLIEQQRRKLEEEEAELLAMELSLSSRINVASRINNNERQPAEEPVTSGRDVRHEKLAAMEEDETDDVLWESLLQFAEHSGLSRGELRQRSRIASPTMAASSQPKRATSKKF